MLALRTIIIATRERNRRRIERHVRTRLRAASGEQRLVPLLPLWPPPRETTGETGEEGKARVCRRSSGPKRISDSPRNHPDPIGGASDSRLPASGPLYLRAVIARGYTKVSAFSPDALLPAAIFLFSLLSSLSFLTRHLTIRTPRQQFAIVVGYFIDERVPEPASILLQTIWHLNIMFRAQARISYLATNSFSNCISGTIECCEYTNLPTMNNSLCK